MKVKAKFHTMSFDKSQYTPAIWVYLWCVKLIDNDKFWYVGKTDDDGFTQLDLPFNYYNELSESFENDFIIYNLLDSHGLDKKNIKSLELSYYGPISTDIFDSCNYYNDDHKLAVSIKQRMIGFLKYSKCKLLNDKQEKDISNLDPELWDQVVKVIAKKYPELEKYSEMLKENLHYDQRSEYAGITVQGNFPQYRPY